jgi:hypothetical protein
MKLGYFGNILNTSKVLKCSFWRRLKKISWADRERNEVLRRVTEERNILHTITRRKVKWIGQILRRNWFLNHVVEGNVEGRIELMGGRGRRGKQICNSHMERKGYWKMK